MFDGNYRTRRTINLGSQSRNRRGRAPTTQSKASLLESTRKQREERQKRLKLDRAARLCQRIYRGWKCRQRLSLELQQQSQASALILARLVSRPLRPFFQTASWWKYSPTANGLATPWQGRCIVQAVLERLRPQQTTPELQAHLLQLLVHLWNRQEQDEALLWTCTQRWLTWSCASQQDWNVTQTLWNYSLLHTQSSLGALAAILFGIPNLSEQPAWLWNSTPPETYLQALVTELHKLEPLLNNNKITVLQNALQLTRNDIVSSQPLLWRLIRYVLDHHFDLGICTSLLVLENDGEEDQQVGDELDSLSDDEESDEEMEDVASRKRASTTTTTRTVHTRQDLQTISKLDALYRQDVQRWRKRHFPEEEQALARQMAQIELWTLSQNHAPNDDYVTVVNCWLQCSSTVLGMKFSKLVRPLATWDACQALWNHFTATTSHAALLVFSEFFWHYLTTLSDGEFLKIPGIQDVIVQLRSCLYELYWNKPVLAQHMQVLPTDDDDEPANSQRARLLLVGTKLWNSLYERWCRLVRHHVFVEESIWWFPQLSWSARDGGVVTSAVVNNHDDSLADSFRDPKMARILTYIPQAVPFERRVKLFHALLSADKTKTQNQEADFQQMMARMLRGEEDASRAQVEIRRDSLYQDSMQQLNKLGSKLKHKVQVAFINQHGTHEAGIDGGGVFQEFLGDLIVEAFSQSDGTYHGNLFSVTPLQTLAVNLEYSDDPAVLEHYEFLGRVLGKAVYESILVEPQFCLPFLNQLLGKANSLEDLKNLDVQYYNNLSKLRSLSSDEIDDLHLTFEITVEAGKSSRTVELIPNGHDKAVTIDNVLQFVHLVAHQRLNVQGAHQTRAFLRGFRDLIPASWVRLFSANELQKLIGGDDSIRGIDVLSLQRAMQYSAGYHPSQPIIQWFWEILEEFTPQQQRNFLKFMTSCSRQPLLGFGALDPPPCIQQIRLADALFLESPKTIAKQAPLPTSSTCMNLFKLPNYRNKELLRKKLLDAIEAGAGFELT